METENCLQQRCWTTILLSNYTWFHLIYKHAIYITTSAFSSIITPEIHHLCETIQVILSEFWYPEHVWSDGNFSVAQWQKKKEKWKIFLKYGAWKFKDSLAPCISHSTLEMTQKVLIIFTSLTSKLLTCLLGFLIRWFI